VVERWSQNIPYGQELWQCPDEPVRSAEPDLREARTFLPQAKHYSVNMTASEFISTNVKPRQLLLGRAGIGAASLLAANAGLAYIYFAFDLTLYQLVLIYWWECLWIGVFSGIKLVVASAFGDPYSNRYVSMSAGSRILVSVVLVVKVSAVFVALLGLLGIAIFSATETLKLTSPSDQAMNQVTLILGSSLLFLLGHGLSFIVNFLVLGEFRQARARTLMFLPFKRCLALVVCIGIGFAVALKVPGLATTSGFAAVVIVIKILWDLWLHVRERRSLAVTRTAGAAD